MKSLLNDVGYLKSLLDDVGYKAVMKAGIETYESLEMEDWTKGQEGIFTFMGGFKHTQMLHNEITNNRVSLEIKFDSAQSLANLPS